MSRQCSEAQAVRPEEKEVLGTEGEEGDHEGEHDGEDEEQHGERKTMKVLDPVEPTEQEVVRSKTSSPTSVSQLVQALCTRARGGDAAQEGHWRADLTRGAFRLLLRGR